MTTPAALARHVYRGLCDPRPAGAGLHWRRALDDYGRPGYVRPPALMIAPRVFVVRVPLDSGDVPAALRPATAEALASYIGAPSVRVTRDREHVRVEIPRPDGGVLVALPAAGDAIAVAADGRWLALALDDHAPHALVAGATGSGKTTACAALALVESRRGRVIVVNPKSAPEYAPLGWLGHTVAMTPADIAAALAWAAGRIGSTDGGRVVVIVDEWTLLDAEARATCERIATLGRSADLHLVIGTQYPRADVVSTITRVNVDRVLTGKMEPAASRAILGDTSAAGLLGCGDMLLGSRSGGPGGVERVQVALVNDEDWATAGSVAPLDVAPAPTPAPKPVHPSQAPTPTPAAWHAWIIDRALETGAWPGALAVGEEFGIGTGRARRVLAEARALVGEDTGYTGIPGGSGVAPGRVVGSIAAR